MRLTIGNFSRAYPLIYTHPWSLYMRAYFFGPDLLYITRETCRINSRRCSWTILFFRSTKYECQLSNKQNSRNSRNQWFSTAGTRRGTGTWRPFYRDLKHYKNLKCIKKCIKIKHFSIKSNKTIFTGTIDHKTNIYRDKRLQKTFYRDLNQKSLRSTALY